MPISESWRSFGRLRMTGSVQPWVFVASCPVSPTRRLGTIWMIRSDNQTVRQVRVRIHANLLHLRYLFSEIDWNTHNPFSLQFPDSCLQKRLDLSSENSRKIHENVRKWDADFRTLTKLCEECKWPEVHNPESVCGFLPGQSYNAFGGGLNDLIRFIGLLSVETKSN